MVSLGIQAAGQLVSPGLSWRTEFVRQFAFSLMITLVSASIVSFVIGFSSVGIQGGSLASAFGAIDRISSVNWLRTAAVFDPNLGSDIPSTSCPTTLCFNAFTQPGDAADNQDYEPGSYPRLYPYDPPAP
jgi:hypothetical protein